MTDLKDFSEQFEAWWLTKFSKEFLDSDNCWSAWTGWQARGELDAVRIKELEAKNKELEELIRRAMIPTQEAMQQSQGNPVCLRQGSKLVAGHSGVFVEDRHIKDTQIAELTAKLDKAREALKWIDKVNAMDSEYVRVARQALVELDK